LQKRMRLQTDPTVIYGIGSDFNGNLTRRDLQTDTPYNTYTRHGLPPTPIALPGRAAIHAALHPADGEELFFVATGLGDGSHEFSATKEQHDDAVARYLRQLRRQRQQGN
ncbi:MAG: endolytic transglycosylase MltG, partial [Gammaproteobacteria bacterium]|nr:endolytic transglycosylase MltG [Gammaproteobacteria bacterium]